MAKIELQAFRGKMRDLEVSREKWRVQAEESESDMPRMVTAHRLVSVAATEGHGG